MLENYEVSIYGDRAPEASEHLKTYREKINGNSNYNIIFIILREFLILEANLNNNCGI